jgi:hypothetical protein
VGYNSLGFVGRVGYKTRVQAVLGVIVVANVDARRRRVRRWWVRGLEPEDDDLVKGGYRGAEELGEGGVKDFGSFVGINADTVAEDVSQAGRRWGEELT